MLNNNIIIDQIRPEPIVDVSGSSITINIKECQAPSLSIDGLNLPNNMYSIISVAGIGDIVVMTLYVRNYDFFNTFTIRDFTNKTNITVSASANNNIVKNINWNKKQLTAECAFDPHSNGAIVINWQYNRFVIVSSNPFFR